MFINNNESPDLPVQGIFFAPWVGVRVGGTETLAGTKNWNNV